MRWKQEMTAAKTTEEDLQEAAVSLAVAKEIILEAAVVAV